MARLKRSDYLVNEVHRLLVREGIDEVAPETSIETKIDKRS